MATQIGTVIDGKYEILKQIGKGGMSVVYLAMDRRLNKQWAVKEIRKNARGKLNEVVVNSLLAEANLMKRLDHPALPRIVDIIDNGQTIYVIMDYIEGESLESVVKEYGAQPWEVVVEWAKQLCDALNYLHSQKPPIIYRDMKPANVMLKPEGNLKVIDFGIAREYKEKNLADTTILGTKGYAPPEQHGARQTDARSDIYALGMTLHHLLTAEDPREPDYMYAPIRQWNPELPGGLERMIDKCTALDPEDRYQNCNELMYALEHHEEEGEAYKKRQKRKLAAFIAAASAALVLMLTGIAAHAGACMRTIRITTRKSIFPVPRPMRRRRIPTWRRLICSGQISGHTGNFWTHTKITGNSGIPRAGSSRRNIIKIRNSLTQSRQNISTWLTRRGLLIFICIPAGTIPSERES